MNPNNQQQINRINYSGNCINISETSVGYTLF